MDQSLTSYSSMEDMQYAEDIEEVCGGQAFGRIEQQPSASGDPLQHATAQEAPEQQQVQQTTSVAPEQPAAWQNYSSVFTAAKAGMSGVDQQKVKQVVYEMSKVWNKAN